MKWLAWAFCLCVLAAVAPAQVQQPADWPLPNFAQRLSLDVLNPSSVRVSTLVTLRVPEMARIAPGFPGKLAITLIASPSGAKYAFTVTPSQADDLDGDGEPDEFEFPVELAAGERRRVQIYYSTSLSDRVVYAQRAHASHAYGYNHQTATLESDLIGYRTYGGFLLDVEARAAGHPGLYNDMVGFLAAHQNFATGKDVFHVGDTLGLGGIFLRRNGKIYRPPFNVPDYACKPSPLEVPHYRVIADGPIRAAIDADMGRWTVGDDAVDIRGIYSIDAGQGFARCRFQILPISVHPGHSYAVGVGIRDLPAERRDDGPGRIALAGEQSRALGPLGLAIYYDPAQSSAAGDVQTPEGGNRVVIFHQRLEAGQAVSGSYAAAAAWSGSGITDPLAYLTAEQKKANARVEVTGERFEKTPEPQRIEGEAY
ncbi:MAG: DUF4861 family protein [Terriglobia bacterium]